MVQEWMVMARLRQPGTPPGLAETIVTAFTKSESMENAVSAMLDNLTVAQARMVVETRGIEVHKMKRHSGSASIVVPTPHPQI